MKKNEWNKKEQIANVGNMSYEQYLDILEKSKDKWRSGFECCSYYNLFPPVYTGEIAQIKSYWVLFKQILIDGMYDDGEGFKLVEDHVFIEKRYFKGIDIKVGECLQFEAEVYRYVKRRKGLYIDYGLRNLTNIIKVNSYDIPTNHELFTQALNNLSCEVCTFTDHCNRYNCLFNK